MRKEAMVPWKKVNYWTNATSLPEASHHVDEEMEEVVLPMEQIALDETLQIVIPGEQVAEVEDGRDRCRRSVDEREAEPQQRTNQKRMKRLQAQQEGENDLHDDIF